MKLVKIIKNGLWILLTVQLFSMLLFGVMAQNGGRDYLGAHSFTEYEAGQKPSGWSFYEYAPFTTISINAGIGDHAKVLELYDSVANDFAQAQLVFYPQAVGIVEFWVYGQEGATPMDTARITLRESGSIAVWLDMRFESATQGLLVFNGVWNEVTAIGGFPNNQWHHLKVAFDCATDSFDLWLNGDLVFSGGFWNNVNYINRFVAATEGITYGDFHLYVDALDYSWATDYYEGRILDYEGMGFEMDWWWWIVIIGGIVAAVVVTAVVWRARTKPVAPKKSVGKYSIKLKTTKTPQESPLQEGDDWLGRKLDDTQ